MENKEILQTRMQARFKSIEDCQTVDELVLNLFPSQLPNRGSRSFLVKEWIEHYKSKTKCPNFTHKTPKELAEDIYKTAWDESDGLFQGIRKHLIEWIEKYKTS